MLSAQARHVASEFCFASQNVNSEHSLVMTAKSFANWRQARIFSRRSLAIVMDALGSRDEDRGDVHTL